MFWAQVIATVVAGTVQLGVQSWMFTNIPDICSSDQKDGFTVSVHYRRSHVILTVLSVPRRKCSVRLLSYGESLGLRGSSRRVRYTSKHRHISFPPTTAHTIPSGLVFFFIVGAVCPLVSYSISLKWPNSIFKYVNFPVIFNGSQWIPPATAVNYVPWSIVGFIFNYVIRRRHFSWWTKYNCTFRLLIHCFVALVDTTPQIFCPRRWTPALR